MIQLEESVKVYEKIIPLKDIIDLNFDELQKEGFQNRTRGQFKKDLKYIQKVGNQNVIDLHNVFLHKKENNTYTILNKDEELLTLNEFVSGSYSFKCLDDGKIYYYHNLKKNTLANDFKIHLTIMEGKPHDLIEKVMSNSIIRKNPQEILELLFMSPWITDMQNYFKGNSSPAKRVLNQYTGKKIPNLNLMDKFISYMARANNQSKELYIQSSYSKENASEEWEYYKRNVVDMIDLYGWED